MSHNVLVSVFCEDRTGLVAAISGRMFDLGANLGDTTFSVLGSGAKFTSISEIPDGLNKEALNAELASISGMENAEITVTDFKMDPIQDPSGSITHRIIVSGGDQPGLIARLSELFIEFKANIVRLSSEKTPDGSYNLQISVFIPENSADACISAVANTAEGLQLSCRVESN